MLEEGKNLEKKPEKKQVMIIMDLTELNSIGMDFEYQLRRLKESICRIEDIQEEKSNEEIVKERNWDESSLVEKTSKLRAGYSFLLKKLCYLNEQFESRV